MKTVWLEIDGKPVRCDFEVIDGRRWVHARGTTWDFGPAVAAGKIGRAKSGHGSAQGGDVRAPMPGKLVKVSVKAGEQVTANQVVAVMEAMKMEYTLKCAQDGRVKEIRKIEGSQVALDETLIVIETKDGAGA